MVDVLVGAWTGTIMDMLVEVEVVSSEVWTSVVIGSRIDVVNDELAVILIEACAEILVVDSVS